LKIIKYLLSSILIILVAVFLAYRLLPESSYIAQTQLFILDNDCRSCHTSDNVPADGINVTPDFVHPISDIKMADMEAYFEAIRLNRTFQERVNEYSNSLIQGEQLARKNHCFNCHGILAQGGYINEGSLKGYIPGWFGRDFDILTDDGDPDVITEWIKTGSYQKIIDDPVTGLLAKHYLDKQESQMLKFSYLSDDEIEILVQYVLFIRQYGAMRKADIVDYKNSTMTDHKL